MGKNVGGKVFRYILGIFLFFLSLFFFLSLISFDAQDVSLITFSKNPVIHNLCGIVGSYLSSFLFLYFGYVSFLFPLLLLVSGIYVLFLRRDESEFPIYPFLMGFLIFTLSLSSLLEFFSIRFSENFLNGGIIGYSLYHFLLPFFNKVGTFLLLFTFLISSFFLLFRFSFLLDFFRRVFSFIKDFFRKRKEISANFNESGVFEGGEKRTNDNKSYTFKDVEDRKFHFSLRFKRNDEMSRIEEVPLSSDETEEGGIEIEENNVDENAYFKGGLKNISQSDLKKDLPPLSLLKKSGSDKLKDEEEEEKLRKMGENLLEKLREFKVDGTIERISRGPVVTTFELRPAKGVRVRNIYKLSEDLSVRLAAESIRISRIPGRGTIGIEYPNEKREIIMLRDILESPQFKNSPSNLTIGLGKLIDGTPFVEDLSQMPHLLIAGSTGSGKSVGLNSMIVSILYKSTPEDVRFILIDPKRVELSAYEDIPHLLVPVVLDHDRAGSALNWALKEIKERTMLLRRFKVRNIKEYNEKLARFLENGEENFKKLPYLVIIIDEYADLIQGTSNKKLSLAIVDAVKRIAQTGRAAGIHIIIATQRPSVDVITGVIKANFPARISFKLVSNMDSRTILDFSGAELLLGKGDMLYKPATSSVTMRVHGPFISRDEVNAVCEFWKMKGPPDYMDEVFQVEAYGDDGKGGNFGLGVKESFEDGDPLYDKIKRFVVANRKASTSLIQRHFRIGYNRAARIMDMLEREGVVGPSETASKPRDVLLPPDYFEKMDEEEGNL